MGTTSPAEAPGEADTECMCGSGHLGQGQPPSPGDMGAASSLTPSPRTITSPHTPYNPEPAVVPSQYTHKQAEAHTQTHTLRQPLSHIYIDLHTRTHVHTVAHAPEHTDITTATGRTSRRKGLCHPGV